jgi:osmotically-inducible protein OsmY
MDIGDIDSSEVEVHVRDARVVLEGTVPERSMKYEIEDIAAATLGVTDVENNLRVPRRELAEGP